MRPATIGARRQAAGRVVRRRHRARAHAPAPGPAERGPGQRRDRPRLPALARRPAAPAAAGRRAPSRFTTVPVPLRGRGQGVPDRAAGQLLRRQRRLRRRAPRTAPRSAPSSSQTDGTSPAAVAQPRAARRGPDGAQVTDIATQRKIVGSNLTAVGHGRAHEGRARLRARARRRGHRARARARLRRAPAHVRHRLRAGRPHAAAGCVRVGRVVARHRRRAGARGR